MTADGRTPIDADLLAVLACPTCKGALTLTADGAGLDCSKCRLRFPIEPDGTPNMIVYDAIQLDESGQPIAPPAPEPRARRSSVGRHQRRRAS